MKTIRKPLENNTNNKNNKEKQNNKKTKIKQ